MISQIFGKIEFRGDKFVILDVSGVGYKVFCSEKTLKELPKDGEVKIFTHLILREGETIELYGFLNYDELDLFEKLLGVSGIGPRASLNLASFGSIGALRGALISGKKAIPGIGPKKVQKILLELGEEITKKPKNQKTGSEEAVEALMSLGIARSKAKEAVAEVSEEIEGIENIVKEALKRLGR